MSIPRSLALFLLAAILPRSAGAQTTSDLVALGGPGSCSTEGFDDPGLLSDGQTEASATIRFTLDPLAARLDLEVRNTSPVVPGVPNPLLTRILFNAPAQVTGMSLVSQGSAGGLAPEYALSFDAAPGDGSDPNGAGRFGSFGVELSDTGNIQGTIANPDADTYTVSSDLVALGPCTFVLELAGDLSGLTAQDFTSLLSHIPPGSKPSHAVGKFQAGGRRDASAFISNGRPCQNEGSSVVLGTPCGATLAVTPPVPGGYATVSYDGERPGGIGFLLYSHPGGTPFPLLGCTIYVRPEASVLGPFVTDAQGNFQFSALVPRTHHCGDRIVLQAFAIGKEGVKPAVEISNAVLVTMGS